MKYAICAGAVLALCVSAGTSYAASSSKVSAQIQAAVDDSGRPEVDRARDVNRKPAQVMAFAGIKSGQKIIELIPGSGYFTRMFCKIVGDSGHVYTVNIKPTMAMPMRPGAGPRQAPPPPAPIACDNVTASAMTAAELSLPTDVDVVWTSENYHDLHNAMFGKPDMKALDTAVFNALKPGGEFIIEDHVAEAGSGARDTNALHRIDPELVKKEVTSAGFVFAGESHVLHNPNDPHTAKVFTMVDKTDRFLFKFRKPRA